MAAGEIKPELRHQGGEKVCLFTCVRASWGAPALQKLKERRKPQKITFSQLKLKKRPQLPMQSLEAGEERWLETGIYPPSLGCHFHKPEEGFPWLVPLILVFALGQIQAILDRRDLLFPWPYRKTSGWRVQLATLPFLLSQNVGAQSHPLCPKILPA